MLAAAELGVWNCGDQLDLTSRQHCPVRSWQEEGKTALT